MQQERINLQRQLKLFRRIVGVILLLLLIMLGASFFGKMDDEVTGKGQVAGIREYELKALVSANTVEICKHAGEQVTAGELLLRFDDRNQRDEIARIKHEIKELETEIQIKEKELDILKKDPLPAHFRHTENLLREAKEKLRRSQIELNAYTTLYKQNAISQKEFIKVEMEHLSNKMNAERLAEDWGKLQKGLVQEILDKAVFELKKLRQQHAGMLTALKSAERHLEDYVMIAPDDGIVTDIPPRPGNYYSKGDVILKFAANKNKKIVALVSENLVYKVEPGQRARISSSQYNYLDFGYFTGEVEFVYQLPITIDGQRFYPVKLLLVDEPYPLRFGSGCEVTILTGQERIFFVLTNLNSKDYLKRRTRTLKKVLKIDKKKGAKGAKDAAVETPAASATEQVPAPEKKK